MQNIMRTTQNFNVYYAKLQYLLRLNTGKLQIVLHKIAIVLHYTTLHYTTFLFLIPIYHVHMK